ncbi:hypothetical protein DV711_06320 [Motiliproteus coralliicola]|uniref:Uncharacterized protein n=1 Tax=Motiliproteus coralliicola TaxID=2283196 RepID=A0A369WSU5_9GAMM|nr:hypothetical protein [Motiliproteus coralliicola]RDE25168.1 hypothetical protein DV711_06320 [Motiliproteus coralliicola]
MAEQFLIAFLGILALFFLGAFVLTTNKLETYRVEATTFLALKNRYPELSLSRAPLKDGEIVPQRVVCAANRCEETGKIILGARHFDPFMRAHAKLYPDSNWIKSTQGFIDQKGNFLTRAEALTIALKEAQIIRRCGGDETRLFSENLY